MNTHPPSRRDAAQRWASIVVGVGVVGLVGWMTYEGIDQSARPIHKDSSVSSSSADGGSTSTTTSASATPIGDAGVVVLDLDAGMFMPSLSLGDAAVAMPSSAPRSVKIGVVLVSFAGAEGAPANARGKAEAKAIADRLGGEAKTDFHHAVTSGDSGSADDIGRLPRGVLDPHTEVTVFGLAPGEVSDVLETPRGYWIVKRID